MKQTVVLEDLEVAVDKTHMPKTEKTKDILKQRLFYPAAEAPFSIKGTLSLHKLRSST